MDQKEKIGYLISQYPAVSHTFILREILTLKELGFDIKTASINDPDYSARTLTAEEKEEIVPTTYIKSMGWIQIFRDVFTALFTHPIRFFQGLWFSLRLGGADLKRILWGFFYFIEALLVGQWMKREDLNHVHVHFGGPVAMVALVTAKVFSCTFSMTIHGPDIFYDVTIQNLKEKILASKFVVCISHYARSQLMRLVPVDHWKKIIVCRLGIDPEKYSRKNQEPPAAPFHIISVGRLVPSKGQHILIQSAAQLINRGLSIIVELVGEGSDRKSLEILAAQLGISDHVIFHGALNSDETYGILAKADIFALPSFAEGLPVSLMEAMSMGIPCVTTEITGIPELIRNGAEGFLVSPSNTEDLTKHLAQLIENKDLMIQMGARGRTRILQQYNLKDNVAQLAKTFHFCLSHSERQIRGVGS